VLLHPTHDLKLADRAAAVVGENWVIAGFKEFPLSVQFSAWVFFEIEREVKSSILQQQ
jgi:hypothetical protein